MGKEKKRNGIFIAKYSENGAKESYQWTIYGTCTEVQKYRQKKENN